jgi:hypothetical protein
VIAASLGARSRQRESTAAGVTAQAPFVARPGVDTKPCGTARSMAVRSGFSESGRSFARSVVSTAIMPQPMSTPTPAGMMARRVGMTVPTVEPMPACTSGITATWG